MESITSPGWIEICFWTECNMPARTCASRSAGAPLNAISIALGPGVRTSLAGLELVIFELAPRLIESHPAATRSAERRVGKDGVRTLRSRWSTDQQKKNIKKKTY